MNSLENIKIKIISFGFKYGLPEDVHFMQDVRFLPNPYYIPELKSKSGIDQEVSSYVLSADVTKEYLKRLCSFLDFYIHEYILSGKEELVIAIGCTGGRHRSVTVACRLYSYVLSLGYNALLEHRDISKDNLMADK